MSIQSLDTESVQHHNKIKLALLQCDITVGDTTANRERIQQLIHETMQKHPDVQVILLPEMWNTGYALTEIHELVDDEGRIERHWISEYAASYKVNIVAGSIAEKKDGKIYNSMYVFDMNGEQIARYAKLHLFRLMDEEKYLAAGDEPVTFTLDEKWFCGASICYDIRFPELIRSLALKGAKMLFVPAEWPQPRLHHWRTLLMARAIENQMYVISCNRVGTSGSTSFFGHSMIIDPWGEIVAEGTENEEILVGSIDPAMVDAVRERIPVFEDRRPEIYFKKNI
ncbi:carbon-nitrogen family hydrolase [Paenibacillus shunpengii]|uniref:Carbon-nitrogen family hydrolase n=1 Tax=Paenibacillus shunpengii TaxID=2054424 RepID=A0ABW5SP53_9BACL|nr:MULTISPECIES: carbon-nitrogen family hydrolase [unclassified Paenibacillus]OMC68497.1 carbon-nitrogen hydrolase [Paenibacillus sp. FSL H7-0326]SDW60208.1 Predicted amidohydrolase [Paenibacillus sp. PDC88]